MTIQEYKAVNNLSLEKLAYLLEVPKPTLVGWFYNYRKPSLKAAFKVWKKTNHSVGLEDWFASSEDEI